MGGLFLYLSHYCDKPSRAGILASLLLLIPEPSTVPFWCSVYVCSE